MSLDQNQLQQSVVLGMMDMKVSPGTIACQVDSTQVGSLVSGQSVQLVDSVGGVPKVVAVAADADTVFGFIAYNRKDAAFVAGDRVEIAGMIGNVMYLSATAAIARGALCKGVVATVGGVATAVAASGSPVIGWALDKAVNVGDLIRVYLHLPSFFKA